jgi:radical SAM protein (TIGR01212 family)
VTAQLEEGKAIARRIRPGIRHYIAYFQAFSNTYAPLQHLREAYEAAAADEDVRVLSIATRPDCFSEEIYDLLAEINRLKPVWVELGLQTIHEKTATRIRRGYELSVFEDAYRRLKETGITVIVHVIFGLPGESKEDMLDTIRFLAGLEPSLDGIKIQNLQILKGADMYGEYMDSIKRGDGEFHIMSMEEYTDVVAQAIALLPKETVVHRMTGDGPRKLLVEPLWSLDKKRVLNMLTTKTKGLLT